MRLSGPPLIMGIVNITPDSFSDGGEHFSPENALAQCINLSEHGANYLDLGAESSRPGATKLSPKAEWDRLKPVLELISNSGIKTKISIDTRNASTILRAAEFDIAMVNNISGVFDDKTLQELATKPGLEYVAMHMHDQPATMQAKPIGSKEIVEAVSGFFEISHNRLSKAGFKTENIWLDPGIGFGKTDSANLRLLAETPRFSALYQVSLGVSRKSWIGRTLGITDPVARDPASKLMELGLWMLGVRLIRTHDVKTLNALRNTLIRDE